MGLFDLTGRTALVTGSSMGIGLALARGLAGAGARIVLNARDAGRLTAAAEDLRATGAEVSALVFDVTDADAVREKVDAFEADQGSIDILVNNAGIGYLMKPITEMTIDEWDAVLGVNLRGAFLCTKCFSLREALFTRAKRQAKLYLKEPWHISEPFQTTL